jgi:MFS transporter, DHA3 family, macrolide efflux protein
MIHGLRPLVIVWLGQLVSLIGSGITGFALGIWVYQRTGSATQFAFIAFCSVLPSVLLSLPAGALVDRWNHRWVLICSGIGGALNTLALALLAGAGWLHVWHIYVFAAIGSLVIAVQWPAYVAATTALVPKQHLGRAGGMLQMGQAIAQLAAPGLGSMLLEVIHLQGVVLLELTAYLFALAALLGVRFPKTEAIPSKKPEKDSLLGEIAYGWTYLTSQPGLLRLLMFFAINNFLSGIVGVLFGPLVLSFASPIAFGILMSMAGVGTLISSLVMSIWGGPERRMHAVFSAMFLSGLCILVTGLGNSVPILAVTILLFFFGTSVLNICTQVIFQNKVAPYVQGRIFAIRGAVTSASLPLAYLVAGPLADFVFKPLMAPDGLLAGSLGRFIGVGPGRGIGLMFMIVGTLTIIMTVIAYRHPHLRLLEDELPDAIPNDSRFAESASRPLLPPAKGSTEANATRRLVFPGAALVVTLGLFGYFIATGTRRTNAPAKPASEEVENAPPTLASGTAASTPQASSKSTGDFATQAGWVRNLSAEFNGSGGDAGRMLVAAKRFEPQETMPLAKGLETIGSVPPAQFPEFAVAAGIGSGPAGIGTTLSTTLASAVPSKEQAAASVEAALQSLTIEFPARSARIPLRGKHIMRQAADMIGQLPAGTVVELTGYPDRRGTFAAKKKLSERRAQSVYRAFVRAGVRPEMLRPDGSASLVTSAASAAKGRSLSAEMQRNDRRVELRAIQRQQ